MIHESEMPLPVSFYLQFFSKFSLHSECQQIISALERAFYQAITYLDDCFNGSSYVVCWTDSEHRIRNVAETHSMYLRDKFGSCLHSFLAHFWLTSRLFDKGTRHLYSRLQCKTAKSRGHSEGSRGTSSKRRGVPRKKIRVLHNTHISTKMLLRVLYDYYSLHLSRRFVGFRVMRRLHVTLSVQANGFRFMIFEHLFALDFQFFQTFEGL